MGYLTDKLAALKQGIKSSFTQQTWDTASDNIATSIETYLYGSRSGQILEMITGLCDGRVVQGQTQEFTFPNVTSRYFYDVSYQDLPGSTFTYLPP
jgi:hypothetical protein